MDQALRKHDALWLLAWPVYQVIGTTRHELSHAVAAWLQGARITEIRVLPSRHPTLGFTWGYVRWEGGQPDWLTSAAPYLVDIGLFALVLALILALLPRIRNLPRWVRIQILILGLVAPWADVVYNYGKVFLAERGDIARLLALQPPYLVHGAVLLALAGMTVGLRWGFRRALAGPWGP